MTNCVVPDLFEDAMVQSQRKPIAVRFSIEEGRRAMNELRSNQDLQTIGLYEVFLHSQGVVISSPHLESARIFKPDEALQLLEWLDQHRDNFRQATTRHADMVFRP